MKRFFAGIPCLLICIFILSGCSAVGEKSANLSTIYGTAAFLSLVLLVGCWMLVRKNRFWFLLLFSSVLVVNIGYTILSVSSGLEMALWANRISYLGSVCLPLSMLMILLDVTGTACPKQLPIVLGIPSLVMFLIAASPGILPVYYKEVSFTVVNGVSTLVKVYGPLHPLYLVFLLSYFAAMVTITVRANLKKTIDTTAHAIIISIAVFVNIGVWFIEQLVSIDFEMLSISYIISELFLLSVHIMMNELHRVSQILQQINTVQTYPADAAPETERMLTQPIQDEAFPPERLEAYISGLTALTPTEKLIYDAHIARLTSKEIMTNMNIKESTLKYHNRNIYGKLGVATRKELLELHKHIQSRKSKLEEVSLS